MAINPFNTILIFDWDDTLFPTSWLKFQNPNHNLKLLDDICVTLLNKSMLLGEVVIVTNSTGGWVKQVAKKYLPRVYKLLTEIQIISARSRYIDSPLKECKVNIFKELIDDQILNVLSFGDSSNDRNALFLATEGEPYIYSKNIKFLRTPAMEELKTELSILIDNLDNICRVHKNLDLILLIKN